MSSKTSEKTQRLQPRGTIRAVSPEERADKAFSDPETPRLYVNGFIPGHSSADMHLVLFQNGIVTGIMNMSFTTAKTLYTSLGQLISEFESKTNHTVMVMQDVAQASDKQDQPK